MIKSLKIKAIILIMVSIYSAFSFLGCATTIHEDKPSSSSEGSITQIKVDPQKIKLIHDF